MLASFVQWLVKKLIGVFKVVHNQSVRPSIDDQDIVHDGIEEHTSRTMMSLIEQLSPSQALLFKVEEIHTVV